MKNPLLVILAFFGIVLLTSCGPQNYSEVRQLGYNYTALTEPENRIGENVGVYGTSQRSQYEATNNAMSLCRKYYNNCVVTHEGSRFVYVTQEEKNKKRLQTSLIQANNKAKNECLDLGFTSGSKEYADCNLKLSTIYKEEALEEQKLIIAEQQAENARRQAEAAKAQAAAQERIANERSYQDSMSLIQQGQRMMSGACTLGIDC